MNEIKLRFGGTAPSLRSQFFDAGIPVPSVKCARWQDIAHSITRLHVSGYMTDRQATTARKRLMKEITQALKT